MKNKIYMMLIFYLMSYTQTYNAYADLMLTEDAVIQSALKHYPKIYINEEKIRVAESKLTEATGEFDAKLETKYNQFTSGYYQDIGYLETKIIKPLPVANAKVYTGYVKSNNGQYPEVSQYFNTQSNGRAIFGFEFSLLRGFLINEQQALVKMANIDTQISNYSSALMQKQIVADARKAYWKYIYSKKILALYQQMLEIANKRDTSIRIQVRKGDKAAILIDENQRVILRRKSALQSITREVMNAAASLSMYLRGDSGNVEDVDTILNMNSLDVDGIYTIPNDYRHDAQEAQNHRLDIIIATSLLNQKNIKMNVHKNQLLPIVDVGFETSQDYGSGMPEKNQRLNKIKLNITIPLENKKQSGKLGTTSAEYRMIKHEIHLLKDSIANEISITYNKLIETDGIYKNAKQEIDITKKLLDAEIIRFKNGDSDFFMLNAREQDLLNAEEYFYKLKLALVEVSIEYNFMTKDSLITSMKI